MRAELSRWLRLGLGRVRQRWQALWAQVRARTASQWLAWCWGWVWVPAHERAAPMSWRARLGQCARGLRLGLAGLARTLGAALWLLLWPARATMRGLARVPERWDLVGYGQKIDRSLLPWLDKPWLHVLLLYGIAALGVLILTTPLSPLGQAVFVCICWASVLVLRRLPGPFPALALSFIGMMALGRYLWWRVNETLDFNSAIEALLGYGLLAAEAYTWLIAALGFVQTAWPLKRPPAPMQGDRSTWPTVDVFIPTYNEGLSVVQPTVLAALSLDWPADKLRVYLLDDGRRPAFRAFAQAVGAIYMDRPDNRHAKAGNLNHALAKTEGELIAIFDCDHIPTRGFLTATVGWLQRDAQCAVLQTPHHFFSPDPFERNLGTFRRVPNEGALFYGLLQDGNDLWNASFFCGSCAVIRRGPLMEVGGIAVETVTEDAHTSLKLHRRGYRSAYIGQALAAGLATESLSAHVGQRIRWARGMAQIFRTDNPILGPGLTLVQRICYATAMLHFFFGLPRLVFLTVPLCYLFFGWSVINADSLTLLFYVAPYLLLTVLATAHQQGQSRHSYWAEVYETVLAAYVTVPTLVAMFKPSAGTFNVTAKGGLIEKPYFDWAISAPYFSLAVLNAMAFVVGLLRLFVFNPEETSTVLLNLAWTAYSLLILGAAVGVAAETKQVRRTQRVNTLLPAVLHVPGSTATDCTCVDYSMTGLGLRVPPDVAVPLGQWVQVGLRTEATGSDGGVLHLFPARVLMGGAGKLGLAFEGLSHAHEQALVQCTFARADAWDNWKDSQEVDRPLLALRDIFRQGWLGYAKLGRFVHSDVQRWGQRAWQAVVLRTRKDKADAP